MQQYSHAFLLFMLYQECYTLFRNKNRVHFNNGKIRNTKKTKYQILYLSRCKHTLLEPNVSHLCTRKVSSFQPFQLPLKGIRDMLVPWRVTFVYPLEISSQIYRNCNTSNHHWSQEQVSVRAGWSQSESRGCQGKMVEPPTKIAGIIIPFDLIWQVLSTVVVYIWFIVYNNH